MATVPATTQAGVNGAAPSPPVLEGARFLGGGISFKAKLIGTEEVTESRGEKMCHVSMAKLKAVVLAMKEHKRQISVNITMDGVRLVDDKTEEIIHTHFVHRISFIYRDTTDSRAFGYIYSMDDGRHYFFAIKTAQLAEAVVSTLRDLFEAVYVAKKYASNNSSAAAAATESTAAAAVKQPQKTDATAETANVSGDNVSQENKKNEEKHKLLASSQGPDLLGMSDAGTIDPVQQMNAWILKAFEPQPQVLPAQTIIIRTGPQQGPIMGPSGYMMQQQQPQVFFSQPGGAAWGSGMGSGANYLPAGAVTNMQTSRNISSQYHSSSYSRPSEPFSQLTSSSTSVAAMRKKTSKEDFIKEAPKLSLNELSQQKAAEEGTLLGVDDPFGLTVRGPYSQRPVGNDDPFG